MGRLVQNRKLSLREIAGFFMFILVFTTSFTFVTGFTHGLFPSNNIIYIGFITFLLLMPTSFVICRIVHVRFHLLPLLISFGFAAFIIYKADLLTNIACRTQNVTYVRDLNGAVQNEVKFCGMLNSCEIIPFDESNSDYEVCLISDVWDTTKTIQYININITNSNDPLVQTSNEANLLQTRQVGTLIIASGFVVGIDEDTCYFEFECASSLRPFASVYKDKNLLND